MAYPRWILLPHLTFYLSDHIQEFSPDGKPGPLMQLDEVNDDLTPSTAVRLADGSFLVGDSGQWPTPAILRLVNATGRTQQVDGGYTQAGSKALGSSWYFTVTTSGLWLWPITLVAGLHCCISRCSLSKICCHPVKYGSIRHLNRRVPRAALCPVYGTKQVKIFSLRHIGKTRLNVTGWIVTLKFSYLFNQAGNSLWGGSTKLVVTACGVGLQSARPGVFRRRDCFCTS